MANGLVGSKYARLRLESVGLRLSTNGPDLSQAHLSLGLSPFTTKESRLDLGPAL